MYLKPIATKFGKGAISKTFYIYETYLRLLGRFIQLIFALTVLALYGSRVHSDHKAGNPQAFQWVYAVFLASLSSLTAILFAIPQPFIKTARLFIWDCVLGILWISIFGIFAVIFLRIPRDDEHTWYHTTRVSTMRHAVWVDLVNAVLWLATSGYGCFRTFVSRKVDETIDGALEKIENKVSDKLDETPVGVQMKNVSNVAARAMPYVPPRLAPKIYTPSAL
ncbi:hypothetical protein GGR50DRAFT_688782 [Xylaria sp. CBS 124048]|nr:hypothetical protein GGR50DRAFT_688782 [Xylaria sp. CBS 124048]